MKRYNLGTPPTSAGIYHLTNKRTGHVYVGQSAGLNRRFTEWKSALRSGFGHTNYEMQQALVDMPDLDEWEFVVVIEMPGASRADLLAAEQAEIGRLNKVNSSLVLNTPPNMKQEVTGTRPPQSGAIIIRTKNGGFVGQATAAKLLGRNIDTIRDKVRWLRERGIEEVLVDDLVMDRRKILEKQIT